MDRRCAEKAGPGTTATMNSTREEALFALALEKRPTGVRRFWMRCAMAMPRYARASKRCSPRRPVGFFQIQFARPRTLKETLTSRRANSTMGREFEPDQIDGGIPNRD